MSTESTIVGALAVSAKAVSRILICDCLADYAWLAFHYKYKGGDEWQVPSNKTQHALARLGYCMILAA